MLTVYIGATFSLAGQLQQDGRPADFTGWTVQAALYDYAGKTQIAPLAIGWVEQSKGLFTLSAPSTSAWPACKARIDMMLTTPDGKVILGPPAVLRIAQSTLSS